MDKYICNICGYVYDEEKGDLKAGINPVTNWEDVPESWVCPLCGAKKINFTKEGKNSNKVSSNLGKGCEKQYLEEESKLFMELSQYFKVKADKTDEDKISNVLEKLKNDNENLFINAREVAKHYSDRGALRALTWSEKVTKMLESVIASYNEEEDRLLKNAELYVCEICGFTYVGNDLPEVCPVCKVPNFKMRKLEKGE